MTARVIAVALVLSALAACNPYEVNNPRVGRHPDTDRAALWLWAEWERTLGVPLGSPHPIDFYWYEADCLDITPRPDGYREGACVLGVTIEFLGNYEIHLAWRDDIRDSRIAHEMLHVILGEHLGDADTYHEDPAWLLLKGVEERFRAWGAASHTGEGPGDGRLP